MSVYPHGDYRDVPTRPGIRARSLVGPQHGITDFFLHENWLEEGAAIPLHTHPVDEVVIVAEGVLTVEAGGETQAVGGGHTVVDPARDAAPPEQPQRRRRPHAGRGGLETTPPSTARAPRTWRAHPASSQRAAFRCGATTPPQPTRPDAGRGSHSPLSRASSARTRATAAPRS